MPCSCEEKDYMHSAIITKLQNFFFPPSTNSGLLQRRFLFFYCLARDCDETVSNRKSRSIQMFLSSAEKFSPKRIKVENEAWPNCELKRLLLHTVHVELNRSRFSLLEGKASQLAPVLTQLLWATRQPPAEAAVTVAAAMLSVYSVF